MKLKLTGRFFITHGSLVLLTLFVSFGLLYFGSRILLNRESAETQRQTVEAFALAGREAALQLEDVAVLNFMRHTATQPSVLYTAYSNPRSGLVLVFPQTYQSEAALQTPGNFLAAESRKLKDQTDALVWTRPISLSTGKSGWVQVAYSQNALHQEVGRQVKRWMGLAAAAAAVALFLGWWVAWLLARQLVEPLKRIKEGTHLVRSGQLDSLVAVDRPDEIGDLARDFNSMVLQLKELDEMKRDFIAGVEHDFGTPLHAIRSASNYLQAGDAGTVTDKQAEYLLMISNSTQHLITFVNNLLTVSRIEAAKVLPYFEPVDVMAHTNELVMLYQAHARERGVELKLIRKAPYISLVADVTMYRQMVTNLISNALKFTSHGTVEVTLSETDGDFVLEVKDTGIGIDPKHQALIFDKFYRIKQPKDFPNQQGSGLGLSITKGLAEAHGGSITVESTPGVGSTFRLRLPKQPSPTLLYAELKEKNV
jgi:signal transduction histidine kinase